jgi:LytS/YehU family sensor histidine kinase
MRFGKAIKINQHILEEDLGKNIPVFALQMLIENALKHNSFSEKKPLNIDILTNGRTLIVKNNLLSRNGVESSGTGLSNLSKRYNLLGDLDIEIIRTDEYFSVAIPLL